MFFSSSRTNWPFTINNSILIKFRKIRWSTLVSSPILLQGFANSDKSESNPNKQLSDERKLQNAIRDLSPISSQVREALHTNSHIPESPHRNTPSPQILSPSAAGQSPRMVQSSSPISVPTSPVVSNSGSLTPTSSAAAALNFGNPFGLAGRPFLTSPGLLPPGMNPFFPHAGMMLPNPFQRFPSK